MEPSTLPVHLLCCESARSRPACLKCTRECYKLNNKPDQHKKAYLINSFNNCGCKIKTQQKIYGHYKKVKSHGVYKHTQELWMIRDLLGESECPNMCGCKFETTAELYRHVCGEHKTHNCMNAYTACSIVGCTFKGLRKDIEEHVQECHSNKYVYCHVCKNNITKNAFRAHIHEHFIRYKMCNLEANMNNLELKNIEVDIMQHYSNATQHLCPKCNSHNFQIFTKLKN